jgi:hypothetical protein
LVVRYENGGYDGKDFAAAIPKGWSDSDVSTVLDFPMLNPETGYPPWEIPARLYGRPELFKWWELPSSPTTSARTDIRRTASTSVGRAVLQNSASIELLASSFLSLIDEKLLALEQTLPNSPEAKSAREQEIAFWEDLKNRFEVLLAATTEFSVNSEEEDSVVESTNSLVDGLRNWWTERHVRICEKAFDMGLFSLGIGVCSLAGAGGVLSTILPGVLVGGKPVISALKAWSKAKQKEAE